MMDSRHTSDDSNKTPLSSSSSSARWLTLNRRAFMLAESRIPPCGKGARLGGDPDSSEHIVCDADGVYKSRTITCTITPECWGVETFNKFTRTPWTTQGDGTHDARLFLNVSFRPFMESPSVLRLHEGLRTQEEVDLQNRQRHQDRLDRQDRARVQERGRAMTWRSQHERVDEPTTYLRTADAKAPTMDQRRNNLLQRYLGPT